MAGGSVCGSFDACQICTGLGLLGCLYYLVGETDFHFLYKETDYYIEMIKILYRDEEMTLQLVIQLSEKDVRLVRTNIFKVISLKKIGYYINCNISTSVTSSVTSLAYIFKDYHRSF